MIEYEDVILAIDEGTSGTRAATVARNSQVHCLEYQPFQVGNQRHGIVEQDTDETLQTIVAACRTAIANAQRSKMRTVALAITTQRPTAVLWGAGTGKALASMMVWQDARFTDELAQLAPYWDAKLLPLIGRPIGIHSPYLWTPYHIISTSVVKRVHQVGMLMFGTVDSRLLRYLAQEKKCVTTPTNATSAGAYCPNEYQYHLPWLRVLNFPASLLSSLYDDADDSDTMCEDTLGISVPIRACAGDQFTEAIGLGCIEHGQAFRMHGIGSFVDLMVGPTVPTSNKSCESALTMTARHQKGCSHFSIETFAPITGPALNWVCEKLRWFDSPEQISESATQASDSGGMSFIPTLTGLCIPHLQPQARASLNGILILATRPQVAYAILGGITHSVTACIRANEAATGIPAQELVVGGGLSNSGTLLQIQADVSGIPVRRMAEAAWASLCDVAFLTGTDGLLWDSLPDACATLKTARLLEPKISHDLREQKINRWGMRIALEIDATSSFASANQERIHS